MKKLLRLFFPLSLRVRFLLATAAVVLVLSLAYGMVALIGYSVSFDKTTFRLLRGESNLFYTLAKWENNKLHVELPENIDKQSPTMTLIYDENGQLLWAQRDVPWLMKMIQPDWLKSNGFHEIEADVNDTSLLLSGDHSIPGNIADAKVNHCGGGYHSGGAKKFLYGLELVYLCALSQSAVSDPAAVGRRLVEFTPHRSPGKRSPRTGRT